jgi:hypothetical protein
VRPREVASVINFNLLAEGAGKKVRLTLHEDFSRFPHRIAVRQCLVFTLYQASAPPLRWGRVV